MWCAHLQLPAKDSDLWDTEFHLQTLFGNERSSSEVEPFHMDIQLQMIT